METNLSRASPHQFAHLFFTPTPIDQRRTVPKVGNRMTDVVKGKLLPFRTRNQIYHDVSWISCHNKPDQHRIIGQES